MSKLFNVVFIHGRPEPNSTHAKYARSVGANFIPLDSKLRYHDKEVGPLKRYLSWIVNALTFKGKKKYDVFLSEEAYFMVGLLKALKIISNKQKIVALAGSHTLYFLASNRYSPATTKASKYLLMQYDAIICIGKYEAELLNIILGPKHNVKVYTIFNGISPEVFSKLNEVKPKNNNNIIFIGDIANSNRIWIKGLDLMLEAFNILKINFPSSKLTIIGNVNLEEVNKLIDLKCPLHRTSIELTGRENNIAHYLGESSVYLHCARGEAWGISITEAMLAGVIPIVSNETGAKEVVEQVDARLVVKLDAKDIADRIKWVFGLPLEQRSAMSKNCKEIVCSKYTEDNAVLKFQATFKQLLKDLNVGC